MRSSLVLPSIVLSLLPFFFSPQPYVRILPFASNVCVVPSRWASLCRVSLLTKVKPPVWRVCARRSRDSLRSWQPKGKVEAVIKFHSDLFCDGFFWLRGSLKRWQQSRHRHLWTFSPFGRGLFPSRKSRAEKHWGHLGPGCFGGWCRRLN